MADAPHPASRAPDPGASLPWTRRFALALGLHRPELRAVLRDFKDAIAPEDVFLLNDPYTAGGNHLPDWVIARPVFVGKKLVAFACNRAHQADIGGGAAGTYNSAATEIFHEGIRLPVLKLIEGGRTRDDLWRLLMLNTRLPEALDGDLRAMIGSTRIGAERLIHELRDGPGVAGHGAQVRVGLERP